MREIKYRAYNKNTKQIEEVKEISFFKDDFVLTTRDMKTSKMQEQINSNEAELIQFTGLLDKKGVEIYEGDIVKLIHKEGQKPFDALYVSEFRDGCFMFREHYKGGANQWIGTITETPKEVIGNIYSNPKLLEL